jgi:outer membrane receptor protein involved in Fe transport
MKLGGALLFTVALSSQSTRSWAEEPVTIEVHAPNYGAQRGVGDMRVTRDQLEASPRQQASELLAAAPGFFVDHEDGEGLGNDVYLRGFDLEHGSGIEMRLGPVPINSPIHIQGQGYADADFIIPEVVDSIRVLEGCYDPRQGDSAIVGSASFTLGVPERGYQLKASYGSFAARRVLGIVAPRKLRDDTFLAFAARKTDGFGVRRSAQSAHVNGSYGVELGARTQLRLLATTHAGSSELPGVVRSDDVDAGRIDFYGSYPYFAENQGVKSARATLSAELVHRTTRGGRLSIAPWLMWTDFRARQNYTGALETSQQDPSLSGLGDLFQTKNRETAAGIRSYFRDVPRRLAPFAELILEPGTFLRGGRTSQAKSLIEPATLSVWDRRLEAALTTLDLGAYVDADLRLFRRLRLVGGVRADWLAVNVDDRLALSRRASAGLALSPRATLELEATPEFVLSASYGEGFRSLDAAHLPDGDRTPFSKVRSVEVGLKAKQRSRKYVSTLALFRTWVENELVFAAEEGGLETQNASIRSGVVGSFLARPAPWFLASFALSVVDAQFRTLAPGISHHVPSVPPVLFHTDVSLRKTLGRISDQPVVGRIGAGYSFLAGRHLSDSVVGPSTHILNVSAKLRRAAVEVGVDVYNALNRTYADASDLYISNFSREPGQQRASLAIHSSAAPPTSALASLTLYL